MGSRSRTDRAYIAGFLDGDDSSMLQLKKRNDSSTGIRFMATSCLYQDTRHEAPLVWMQDVFGIGYCSRRKDGITELRVNGFRQVQTLLTQLLPYIRFKKIQAHALLSACEILMTTTIRSLSDDQKRTLVDYVVVIQNEN